MFKKSKNRKLVSQPSAPTLAEILSDMETFHIETPTPVKTRPLETTQHPSLDAWWKMFEVFMEDLKELQIVNTEINGYKLMLESNKLEIETHAKVMKNEIYDQQKLIKTILD